MRIAYVCADPGVPVFGTKGSSVHVQSVLSALLRRGDVSIDLLARRLGGPTPVALRELTLRPLTRPAVREPAQREQALMALDGELHQLLEDHGPYDLVYERHSLWTCAAMQYAREASVPGLLEVNAPLVEEQARHRVLVDRVGAERMRSLALAEASSVIAVSADLGHVLDRRPECGGKVAVIPNGVDPDRFLPPLDRRRRPFTVAFVGTLKPWHGLDVLAETFRLLSADVPDARLLVIGDGPGRADLEAQLVAGGVADRVVWAGAVDPTQVGPLLARADATIAPYPPSSDTYFSPLKVVEGLAAGIPVVASAIGQVETLIVDGSTGLLCPPGDAPAFAHALARLADSPDLARSLGRAGRAHAIRHHTWDGVAARILELAVPTVGALA